MKTQKKVNSKFYSYSPGNSLTNFNYRWFLRLVFKEKLTIKKACWDMKIGYTMGREIVREVRDCWENGRRHERGGWRGDYSL